MNKKLIKSLLGLSCLSLLVACNTTTSESESEVSSTEEVNRPTYDYILEENEVYQKIKVDYRTLNKLSYNAIGIAGVEYLAVDPFTTSYFYGEASVSYPTAELLENETILYTSAWYKQTTHKRNDACVEYVLYNDLGEWYVEEISNTSETFIPFNGAVLSVPKNSSLVFNIGDAITFTKGSIPTYDVGLYNQDGNRMAIRYANNSLWAEKGANLYDSNYLSLVTQTRWYTTATINFAYDKSSNTYYVDKFRNNNKDGRIYTNVNKDGFMVGASLNGDDENVAVYEGVRFNLYDTIKVEENPGIATNSFEFSMNSENTHVFSDGSTAKFTLAKSTAVVANKTRRWKLEFAVNKQGMITENNDFVKTPEGGYKIEISGEGGSEYKINYLLEEVFTMGSRITISGNRMIVNATSTQRMKNMHTIVSSYLEDVMNDLYHYNYSYDIETLKGLETELVAIKEEMDSNSLIESATADYRNYSLMGQINQIYFKIISATNRNEAASIRSAWYIEDYNGTDSNLESMAKHLDEMRANGINEILVSAIENGTSTYDNSEYFKTSSNVKKNNYGEYGNDFLKAITALAHERGMQVQAMIVPLTNGLENCFTELKDCKALSITGADSVATSQGAVRMLDPSNPLVQEKIQLTIDDILKCNPELDGVHLDYIRFGADNNSVNTVMGVTESARVGFNDYCNKYGLSYSFATLSSLKTSLSSNSSIFAKFNEYQQTLITDTVRNIKNVCREYDVPLTCAIADDYQYVKTWKCQDWAQWAQEGIVDGLYLMDYYMGEYWINYYFEDMLKATKNKVMLVTGIDPSYANLTAEYYPKTIKGAVSNINSHGYGLFGTHTQAAKKDAWKLIDDSNWVDSVSAFDKLSVTMAKSSELLLKRCDLIYIESKNQTQQQKEALQADLEALNALITGEDVQSCDAVIAKLEEMSNKTYASNEASNRIVEQFNYMKKIVTTKKSILS